MMLLNNVNIVGSEGVKHILVENGKIRQISNSFKTSPAEINFEFTDAIAFPGLINSHDHLDFNLFSQTGNRIYNNYTEWGNDIHENNNKEINAVLKIPQDLRVQWGLYKNLLNGITTVINHGKQLRIRDDLITVFQDCYSLHSTRFEKNWKHKLNRIFINHYPFVMHVGEGTDDPSHREIDQVIKWNFFKRKIIGVHGVAMDEKQAASFRALIWCPASNYFLLNNTARVNKLKRKTQILLGTDSALTAGWNFWEHLRLAKNTNMLDDTQLFDSISSTAASVWRLNDSGSIGVNKRADIIVAKKKNNSSSLEAFYALNPEDILLVMHKGKIRVFDDELKDQVIHRGLGTNDFSRIIVNETGKYIQGNLPALMKEIMHYYPQVNFPVSTRQVEFI